MFVYPIKHGDSPDLCRRLPGWASCDLMFHQELVDGSSYCTFKMSADVIAAVGDVMSDTLEALGGLDSAETHGKSMGGS